MKKFVCLVFTVMSLASPSTADSSAIFSNQDCFSEYYEGACVPATPDRVPTTIREVSDQLRAVSPISTPEFIIEINGWIGAHPDDVIPVNVVFRFV